MPSNNYLRATYYRTSFAYLNGAVVTEGHAEACREYGHATHHIDGAIMPHCPRCGDIAH